MIAFEEKKLMLKVVVWRFGAGEPITGYANAIGRNVLREC